VAKPDHLRWGIAGIGAGASNLLQGFGRNPHARVTAAADIRADALEAFGREWGVETFSSVEALAESPNVDVVWVATPNHLHAPHVIAAAERGKHVMISKPMALTIEECEAMNEAAERNSVKLLCGHSQGQLAPIVKMAERVESGQYGKLGMVHSWNYTDWIYRPRMPYELDEQYGGGVVFRQSPHHIDIVRAIAGGMVKSVRAQVLVLDPKRAAPGAFTAYLEFTDGTPATIIYNGYGHFYTSEITFGRARMVGNVKTDTTPEEEAKMKEAERYSAAGSPPPEAAESGPRHTAFGFTIASCADADIRQSPDGLWIYTREGKSEIPIPKELARGEAEFEEMYQVVVNGHRPVHDGRWGEATHEVTVAIMQSAREGREIMMSHQVAVRH
jgi:phthalate 4,5-cis-dihydrodiol dehydrogenase